MNFSEIIDRIKLPFREEKELFSALQKILGFYPRNIELYKQALLHKSMGRRNEKGRPLNNERLEFLGDAILSAVVGHIVYGHFEGKREGFLTNTRSKLVSRATLGKLSQEMGISQLITTANHSTSHNSYINGNAFEALVGAIYLDRGYDACMRFMEKRILSQLINLDKVAYKEVNFKSKLLEWSQKNRVMMEYRDVSQTRDSQTASPVFTTQVFIEGVEGAAGTGFSKKESHQQASKETLQRLRREPQFIDAIFAAKADRTKMEEEPVMAAPDIEKLQQEHEEYIREQEKGAAEGRRAGRGGKGADVATESRHTVSGADGAAEGQRAGRGKGAEVTTESRQKELDDMTLDDITALPREKTREEIIAEAEAAAFAEG